MGWGAGVGWGLGGGGRVRVGEGEGGWRRGGEISRGSSIMHVPDAKDILRPQEYSYYEIAACTASMTCCHSNMSLYTRNKLI